MRRFVFNMRDERAVWAPPASVAERLRAALPSDCELIEVLAAVTGRGDGGGVSTEAVEAARSAEVLFSFGLPREVLQSALAAPSRLRWIHSGSAGVASLLQPDLIESDIVLTNSAGIHAEPMAETVIGMMLYFARGLDYAVRAQAAREWRSDIFERVDSGVREVSGTTLGIVGFGGIGRAIAQRAAALGMRVLATRRHPEPHADAEVFGHEQLHEMLELCDVVVLTVPSTRETRGMIGPRELARMRRGSILINVARGDLVDEGALLSALDRGHLRGAALDVFTTEPLPETSPLWSRENLLIMPHVSPTTDRFWERELALMLDNVQRYSNGEDLRNVVDTAAGY